MSLKLQDFGVFLVVKDDCIRLVSDHNDGLEGCPSELGKERHDKCQTESNP